MHDTNHGIAQNVWNATIPPIFSLNSGLRNIQTWPFRVFGSLVNLQLLTSRQQDRCTVCNEHEYLKQNMHVNELMHVHIHTLWWLLTYFQRWLSSFLWGARGKRQKGESSLTTATWNIRHTDRRRPESQSKFDWSVLSKNTVVTQSVFSFPCQDVLPSGPCLEMLSSLPNKLFAFK